MSPTWTVNGLVQGAFCAPANEWQHWRVLLADRSATEKTVGVGSNCEVALLARDGVWRTTAPKVLSTGSISLTGASRADLAVRCTNDSTLTINGTTIANIYVERGRQHDRRPVQPGQQWHRPGRRSVLPTCAICAVCPAPH